MHSSVDPIQYPPKPSVLSAPQKRVRDYPRIIVTLFYLFALYLVVPIIDVPLLGLSLSAPIFFIIAITCILRPPQPWMRRFLNWILAAFLLWIGIFSSTWANGLISGGTKIDSGGISIVIHYAYWLLVFIITAYFFSRGEKIFPLLKILGWGALLLAVLRWVEVLLYGNIGAWTGTHLFSQNSYGFLFSCFSPYLLLLAVNSKGWKALLMWGGNLLLWGAAAVNGSRGSWVALVIGLGIFLLLLTLSRAKKFIGTLLILVFLGGLATVVWTASPRISTAVTSRFNTILNRDQDKSYLIRQLMIQKGIKLFRESPVIGIGADRFTKTSIPLEIPELLSYGNLEHFDEKSAHNSYIGFLAEYGLLGAIPFLLLLVSLLSGGLRSAVYFAGKSQFWALAIFTSFAQMSIHMWAINSITNTGNWFIYGLIVAAIVLHRKSLKK